MEAIAASPIEVGGRTLKIGDIAQVRRGYEEPPSFRIFNDGQPSLMLGVNMRPQFNGLKLDENLGVAESEINKALPLGIHFVKIADQAVNITHAVNEFFIKFRSEEHTSELQSLMRNSYDAFCMKQKKKYKH